MVSELIKVSAWACPICEKLHLTEEDANSCRISCNKRATHKEMRVKLSHYSGYLVNTVDSLDQIGPLVIEKAKEFFGIDIQMTAWRVGEYSPPRYQFPKDGESLYKRTIFYEMSISIPPDPIWGRCKFKLFHFAGGSTWGFSGFSDYDERSVTGYVSGKMHIDMREWPLLLAKLRRMEECQIIISNDLKAINNQSLIHSKNVFRATEGNKEIESLEDEIDELKRQLSEANARRAEAISKVLAAQPLIEFPPEPPEAAEYFRLKSELLHEERNERR